MALPNTHDDIDRPPAHPLLHALRPVAEALGATLADSRGRYVHGCGPQGARQVPLEWEGERVGTLHLPDLHTALPRLLAQVERELGAPLPDLDRLGKQEAVAILERRGAFVLRKGVEDVADALGVSRFTVYNYLARNQEGA